MISVMKRKEVCNMEETLGKRIVAHRKRVGLTQDKLAEALGVTAQAVSKWENDQSCPDISTLPKLAQIFDTTTDALLGLKPKNVLPAEILPEQDREEPEGLHIQNGSWEFQWDGGRKSSAGIAVWLLLVGALALLCALDTAGTGPSLWTLAWATGLLVFGLFGLYPKFSVFRLGCALFGGYFLLFDFGFLPFYLEWELILPVLFLLSGLGLLSDVLRKPKQGHLPADRIGKALCTCEGEHFSCSTAFAENSSLIQLPRLASGTAEVSFGELTVDLRGCEELAENCHLALDCSFGHLTLLIPRRFRASCAKETTFGTVEVTGAPAEDAAEVLLVTCDVSFGQITVQYL